MAPVPPQHSVPDWFMYPLSPWVQVDFLALEMYRGKVSLLWDLGSGSTRLEFPGLDITNNRWTRINATRSVGHTTQQDVPLARKVQMCQRIQMFEA